MTQFLMTRFYKLLLAWNLREPQGLMESLREFIRHWVGILPHFWQIYFIIIILYTGHYPHQWSIYIGIWFTKNGKFHVGKKTPSQSCKQRNVFIIDDTKTVRQPPHPSYTTALWNNVVAHFVLWVWSLGFHWWSTPRESRAPFSQADTTFTAIST